MSTYSEFTVVMLVFYLVTNRSEVASLGQTIPTGLQITEGSQGVMACSSNLQESVEWKLVLDKTTKSSQLVYVRGVLSDKTKFKIDRQNKAQYDLILMNATMGDSGLYVCTEDEGHGNIVESYNLAVSRQLQINPSGKIEKSVGETLNIFCTTDLDESIDVYFRSAEQKQERVLLFTRNTEIHNLEGKVSVSTLGPRNYQITIKNATESLSGTYECVDGNGLGPGRNLLAVNIFRSSAYSTVWTLGQGGGEGSSTTESSTSSSASSWVLVVVVAVVLAVIVFAIIVVSILRKKRGACKRRADVRVEGPHSECDVENAESIALKPSDLDVVEGEITSRSEDAGDVGGLAVLGNKLFVVHNRPSSKNSIEVYDAANLTFERYIKRDNLGVVRGLTACDVNNCIYVSDFSNSIIHRVGLTEKSKVAGWGIVKGEPRGLSVNKNGYVVVCCQHFLIQYTTDGVIVHEIALDDSIYPQHAIQLNDGRFVVSSGVVYKHSLHQVCLIDADGKVLRSLGNKPGRATGQFDEPRHLAVDGKGNIVVADMNNNRIVVLDGSLTFSRNYGVIVDLPHALYFGVRNMLYVGESNGCNSRIVVVRFET